jgi:FemAB-related protein (PEP-CTERM system-associated)
MIPAAARDVLNVTVETTPDAWTHYVSARSDATGYHEWPWRQVFKRAFGHDSIYLGARRERELVGVLPLVLLDSWLFGRALVSLPFLNYGGVVANDERAAAALLDHATELARARRCRHVELRHSKQQFADLPCKRHKVAMRLSLQPPAAMWETLDRKVRNQVRKAQKSGLTFQSGDGELLDDFYDVFARNMRDLGTPVYGRNFFGEILGAFPGRGRVHVVRKGGVPVAAGLTFQTGQTLEIPWASSVREFNALCPNHLLFWSILESAASSGCVTFDFGRSTPDEGTYKFKEQWGATPLPLCWEYGAMNGGELPNTSPTNPKFQLAVSVWKKLPLGVATRLGPSIVRAIP